MLYVNNPNQSFKTYDDVVNIAIANGVDSRRVYIYLAALGVKSALARVISSDEVDYLPAQKIAVKDNKAIADVSVCDHCKGLVFNG